MDEKQNFKFLENHVGVILSSLLISFMLGTAAMIYSNDRGAKVFETNLLYISGNIVDLKDQIKSLEVKINTGIRDRWTKRDHQEFEKKLEIRMDRIHYRIDKMEYKRDKSIDK